MDSQFQKNDGKTGRSELFGTASSKNGIKRGEKICRIFVEEILDQSHSERALSLEV